MSANQTGQGRGVDRQLLKLALDKALCDNHVLPVLVPLQGHHSVVLRSRQASGREIIIKLTSLRNSYPAEAWTYRECRRVGVPVPDVLFYSACLNHVGLPCLVISMVEGEPLFSQPLGQSPHGCLHGQVGELLSGIHSLQLEEIPYRLRAVAPTGAADMFPDWPSFIARHHCYPGAALQLFAQGLLHGLDSNDIDKLGKEIGRHRFTSVLNHGDFGPDHILVKNGRITGIIDAGDSFVGPAEYDLAYLSLYVTPRQFELVLSRYAWRMTLRMVRVYAVIIALHKAARAHAENNAPRRQHFIKLALAAWSCLVEQGIETVF